MHAVREVTVCCARCINDFKAQMTTKAPRFCPECVEAKEKEKRERDMERREAARLLPPKPKKKRKIPYAGWDPREKHYD